MNWDNILTALQGQMTENTFNSNLQGSICTIDDGVITIEVKNALAAEWCRLRLDNHIKRAIRNESGIDAPHITYTYQGTNPLRPAAAPASMPPDPAPDITPRIDPGQAHAESGGFYQAKMKMGNWAPEFNYDLLFWRVYLGDKAYELWRLLNQEWVSQTRKNDPALPMNKKVGNQGWTPPFLISYRKLTRKMGKSNANIIPGGTAECYQSLQRYQAAQQFGLDLLPKCCGAYSPKEWTPCAEGGGRCKYWRPGAIHTLFNESLVTIELQESGRAKVQVLRVLPLLAPPQVKALPEDLQDDHAEWLGKYGTHFDLTPEVWQSWTIETQAPYILPEQKVLKGLPPQNPYLTAKNATM